MAPPGNFDFSRAVREWCFVQVPLMDLTHLRREARHRGLSDFGNFEREAWETLDREEIFVPVAYCLHGSWHDNQPAWLEQGDLLIREENGYRPWLELQEKAKRRNDADLYVLYHHWQLLWLAELQRWLRPRVAWGNLADGLESFYEARARLAAMPDPAPRDELRAAAADWRLRELLLVRVQNMFFPLERGGPRRSNWRGGSVAGLTEDAADWAIEQLETADFAALAIDCGVDREALTGLYEGLALRGLRIDPNEKIFELLDQISRSPREKLTGDARLALDYYDAARILRHWHRRLGEEALPDIDELTGSNAVAYKERHYGTRQTRGNRAVLPSVLEDYGLYPWRVQLIGEGDSEIAVLEEIIEQAYGLTFAGLGIAVTDMTGADIPENAERLLASLRPYANYFLLVFDNEGRARELIDVLQQMKVVEGVSDAQRKAVIEEAAEAARQIGDPVARREALRAALDRPADLDHEPGAAPEFLLWRENLEADNFTLAEMCQVVTDYARDEVRIADFNLVPDDVEAEREARRERAGRAAREAGIATLVLAATAAKDPRVPLSKPDFARLLARYAIAHPERNGERRPILRLAEQLVHLTWADRRLAGGLRPN